MNRDKQQERERKERSAAETTVTVICSLIVLFLLVFSIYHGIVAAGTTPKLTAVPLLDHVKQRGDTYVLPVEVRNHTRPTAEDVLVVIQFTSPKGETVEKEFRIAYLAEQSVIEGYVVLREDPAKGSVQAEIESYKLP